MIMTDKIFNIIIQRIKSEKVLATSFVLHLNGEPLTDRKLIERIKTLKSEFPKSQIRFTTNFSIANEKLIKDIVTCGTDSITISLNSIDKTEYNRIMGGLDYDITVKNIYTLINYRAKYKSNIKIRLSVVASQHNEKNVKGFVDKWRDQVDEIRIIKLGQWVGKEIPEDLFINPEDKRKICTILYRTVNILSNGDYALCCFDPEGIIGLNVIDTPIFKAWKASTFEKIRKHHISHGKTNAACQNCSF